MLAVDLGGTRVRVASVASDGRILSQADARTLAADGPEAIVRQILELAAVVANVAVADAGVTNAAVANAEVVTPPEQPEQADPPERSEPAEWSAPRATLKTRSEQEGHSQQRVTLKPLAVGVAAPGPLDPRTGVVFDTPNLVGWRDFPLRTALSEAFGLPVHVHNDANLAAYGEAKAGAGRGRNLVVYLTVSTGVGGGIVRAGRIEAGANGLAGELGHVIVKAGGPRCNFGHAGCLEALASGTAIARAARARMAGSGRETAGGEGGIAQIVGGDLSARDVALAAGQGDPIAWAIMQEAATMLGLAIGSFVNAYDPDIVIVGGGVSESWDLIAETVRKSAGEVVMAPERRHFEIVRAQLGDAAGIVGAGLWAWENELGQEFGHSHNAGHPRSSGSPVA